MDADDDAIARDRFASELLDAASWLSKADALLGAAAKLEADIDEAWTNAYVSTFAQRVIRTTLPVYLMLAAYAVENILKAFLVRGHQAQFQSSVRQKHELPALLKSHDLVKLAQAAGARSVVLSYRIDLLRRMTRSAVRYGRYPVPIAHDKLELGIAHLGGADIEEVRNLVRDLRDEFATGTYRNAG